MRRLLAACLMLGLAACAQTAPVEEHPPEKLMALVSATTQARVAPNGVSRKVMVLSSGTLLAVEDSVDGWYLADLGAYGDFGKGWLYHDFLTIDPPGKKNGALWPLPAILKNDSVVRDDAGTWAKKLDTLKNGTHVRVVERRLDWYRIDQPVAGWVRHDNAYIDVKAFLRAP